MPLYVDKYEKNDLKRIEEITSNYISGPDDIYSKRKFLRLKNEYYRIKRIENCAEIQKKLYKDKTKREIIAFEINRISQFMESRVFKFGPISNIKDMLQSFEGEITEELYINIINQIIRYEVELGMKIGLFKEFCDIFEDEVNKIQSSDIQYLRFKCR